MSPACRGSMVVIPPFGGGCAGHCAQTADHLGEKRRKWGVVGEVDDALSRWALTWRLRGRGSNANVVSKPPTYAPRLRGRGPNANVVSKPPTYTPRLRGRGPNANVVCKPPTYVPRLVGGELLP